MLLPNHRPYTVLEVSSESLVQTQIEPPVHEAERVGGTDQRIALLSLDPDAMGTDLPVEKTIALKCDDEDVELKLSCSIYR